MNPQQTPCRKVQSSQDSLVLIHDGLYRENPTAITKALLALDITKAMDPVQHNTTMEYARRCEVWEETMGSIESFLEDRGYEFLIAE